MHNGHSFDEHEMLEELKRHRRATNWANIIGLVLAAAIVALPITLMLILWR